MKLAFDIVAHIYVFKELKVKEMFKAVNNVENKCVYQQCSPMYSLNQENGIFTFLLLCLSKSGQESSSFNNWEKKSISEFVIFQACKGRKYPQ